MINLSLTFTKHGILFIAHPKKSISVPARAMGRIQRPPLCVPGRRCGEEGEPPAEACGASEVDHDERWMKWDRG